MAYKTAPHTFVIQGVFYFIRRVPLELRRHYTSSKISHSLRTRSRSVAASLAIRAADKLDEYWFHLRMRDADLPGSHMLGLASAGRGLALNGVASTGLSASPRLSEAVAIYLRLKGSGTGITFPGAAKRSCGFVLDTCGDKQSVARQTMTCAGLSPSWRTLECVWPRRLAYCSRTSWKTKTASRSYGSLHIYGGG